MKILDESIYIKQISKTSQARNAQSIVIKNIKLINQNSETYKNLPELLVITGKINLKTKSKDFKHTFCKDNAELIL